MPTDDGFSEVPYRGEPHPKERGHPYTIGPNDNVRNMAFWAILVIAGVVIGIFAIREFIEHRTYNTTFLFVIYILFFIIMVFAIRDVKKIETLTPDGENPAQDELEKDYLDQLDWVAKGKSRSPLRLTPNKKYHPILKSRASRRGWLSSFTIFTIFIGAVAFITYLSMTFGDNSGLTISILLVIGILGTSLYLKR
jgi:hypothetical protein